MKQSKSPRPITALRYIGNGAALPGYPARDIDSHELGSYRVSLMLLSGLYAPIYDDHPPQPKQPIKEEPDGTRTPES